MDVQDEDFDTELTPKQVVAKLDRYIVGQVRVQAKLNPVVRLSTRVPDWPATGGRQARCGKRTEE